MSASQGFPVLMVVIGLVNMVLIWVGVGHLISVLSGWRALARRYRHAGAPPPHRRRFRSGKLGKANYSGILTVAATPMGLYLAVFAAFRGGHPPLLVPWSEVYARSGQGKWKSHVELRFPMLSNARLILYGTYPEITEYLAHK